MNFIQQNVFKKLRADFFQTGENLDPMTRFKRNKLLELLKNVKEAPVGAVALTNPVLNNRFKRIQEEEPHQIDTNMDTVTLLRIIVTNVNAMLNAGINLKGIIQLGQYLRTKGDKVDFVKLDSWLTTLHIQRLAQLQGSILITFFEFDADEIPFVRHLERGAYKLTLRSLYHTIKDYQEEWHFKQSQTGFVHNNSKMLRRNLKRSMRYFGYAPIETTSNFLHNFARSLSEIEE
ncbi:MAG: hypothetical protein PUD15_02970 [Prevotella sp.]|uniref:hypothetical protein n=1 Tax=Prevotella sp. AGR2160 TaxID=1280674 RepID=UPI00042513FD|nr:hypothetical protein [Prevotella sp. AGR2160]MDD5861508.1 hypothetical protein [Prevotella sp.]